MTQKMQGPKDITIVPQIPLLGPESSYFVDKWKKENRIEDLYDFAHIYVRSHILRVIELDRPQIQTLLRRFLPSKSGNAPYSDGVTITSARMQDIYTAVISNEESELGFRDYGGAGFFFAVIFDHSTLEKMIQDTVERPEVADMVKELEARGRSLGDLLEWQEIGLRIHGEDYFLKDGFLSARDLNDVKAICRQLDRDYVSSDTLAVCTYYCILRLLGAMNNVLRAHGPFTLADLQTDELLQNLFFSRVRYILHYTGPLTNYALLRMLTLLGGGALPARQTGEHQMTFSSDAGFSISYPGEWMIDTTDPSVSVKLYIYAAHANVGAVSVEAADLASGATFDDFINANLENLTNLRDFALISSESITFADQRACKVVWQATIPVQLTDTQIKAMQILVIKNGKGYVVTYEAMPKDFDTYPSEVHEVIGSFTFT
ncbi:MAG: PsbP-related protein [Halobacteriota archaeon]